MKYRRFGKLDFEVSALGFGAMRLPVIDNDQGRIDEPEAIRMIRHAIDSGVNYLDTAYPYHAGTSEPLVGRALRDGYREKVKLATKLPPWIIEKRDDFDNILNDQLKRLETDHIDFYLLHGLNKDQWPKLRDLGAIEWAEKARDQGRIRHIGFSFHDQVELFKEIVDFYDKWVFCQIQYNYMDIEHQAGTEGLEYAAEKGLAVVVMEPLRGGQITKKPPESVARLLADAPVERSLADWAFTWVWNRPEVTTALGGMTTMEQVVENLAIADRSAVGALTDEELSIIDRVREEYQRLRPIDCTECGYCLPCPNDVDIPAILGHYNDGFVYEDHRRSRFLYRMIPPHRQADKCEDCNECEELCPQDLPVAEWLEKAHAWLGPKKK